MNAMRILRFIAQMAFALLLFANGAMAAVNTSLTYYIVPQHSSKYLDVATTGLADGLQIHQWSYTGAENQQFQPVWAGGGYYYLKIRSSQKYFDVSNASLNNGALVWQWTFTGHDNQKFKIIDAGGGYYYIQAKHSGKYLDISTASSADGAKLTQYSLTGASNQKFFFAALTRTYYSDWGKDKPDGGYWVYDDKAQSYLAAMAKNGDYYKANNNIIWEVLYGGLVINSYIPAVPHIESQKTVYVPKGVVQIGAGDSNSDYVIMGSVIEKVGYRRSGGYVTPWVETTASCQTAPGKLSHELWFSSTTSGTVTHGLNYDYTIKNGAKLGSTVGTELGFDQVAKISASITSEISKEWSTSHGTTLQDSWTDSYSYTTKTTVGWDITPGTNGTPAVSVPVVTLYGFFQLGRLYFEGGEDAPYVVTRYNQTVFPVFHNTAYNQSFGRNNSWWLGKLEVPVTSLSSIPGYTGRQNQIWYLNNPPMTVPQYLLQCQGDVAARNFAPAMKPALCQAGRFTQYTCK